jgi:hypothetical protein
MDGWMDEWMSRAETEQFLVLFWLVRVKFISLVWPIRVYVYYKTRELLGSFCFSGYSYSYSLFLDVL